MNDMRCNRCGGFGHMARFCASADTRGFSGGGRGGFSGGRGGGRGDDSCRICGRFGHYARACPQNRGGGRGGRGGRGPRQPRERRAAVPEDVCNRCGQAGHWARDCAEPDTRTDEEKAPRARKPGGQVQKRNEGRSLRSRLPATEGHQVPHVRRGWSLLERLPAKGGSGVTPKLQEAAEQDAAQPATMEDADAGATA